MEHAGPEEIRKHIRVYMTVFASLAVLTVVTVAASWLKVPVPVAILIALMIASVKAFLVAAFFMHLISERAAIYGVLIITFFFFLMMISIPLLMDMNLHVVALQANSPMFGDVT